MAKTKELTILQAVVALISLLIVIGGITISVAVSLAQSEATDERHNKRLEELEQHDAKQDMKAEKRHDEIINVLHEIKLELKDKKDR